jgi:hypothetical protein
MLRLLWLVLVVMVLLLMRMAKMMMVLLLAWSLVLAMIFIPFGVVLRHSCVALSSLSVVQSR